MSASWTGTIGWGMVQISVALHKTTRDSEIKLHMVHTEDGGRIRYKQTCESCGEVPDRSAIGKGYELPDKTIIVLDELELENLPITAKKLIDVGQFVPARQIDPRMRDDSYYIEPRNGGLKPYSLLLAALIKTKRVAVVKYVPGTRQRLAVIEPVGKMLMLTILRWPDELQEPALPFLSGHQSPVGVQELQMAVTLVEMMSGDELDPQVVRDDHQVALRQLIDDRTTGTVTEIGGRPQLRLATPAEDLIGVLQASVAQRKRDRQGTPRTRQPRKPRSA